MEVPVPEGSAYIWISTDGPPALHYKVRAMGKWWNATIPLGESTPELEEEERKGQ